MPVSVSATVFEGPFEVLLRLVGEQKVDVYDVRVSDIVDAFVAEMIAVRDVGGGRLVDLEETSEFLVIAAILIELKSKRLLPGPDDIEGDEEISRTEERDLLLGRLLELQVYAAAANEFEILIERSARSIPRSAGLEDPYCDLAPDLLAGVKAQDLAEAFLLVSTPRVVPGVDLSHVTVEAVTVSEAVEELQARLSADGRATFVSLTSHCTSRIQVIVRFLALLELCKRGRVELDQGDRFGDLHVSWIDDPLVLSSVGSQAMGESPWGPVEEYDG